MPVTSGIIIPVSVLLIPLGLFLILYVFYTIFNVYHLLRFGVYGFGLYLFSALFMLGTLGLVSTSIFFLLRYDWNTPIQFNQFLEANETIFSDL